MCRDALMEAVKEHFDETETEEAMARFVDKVIDAAKLSIPESDWEKSFVLFNASAAVLADTGMRLAQSAAIKGGF